MISIIAAVGKNKAIGKDNRLLWDIPEDLQRFKRITWGHPVIMGSKTFESIGRPLPGRLNIVLSKNKNYQAPPEVKVSASLEQVLRQYKNAKEEAFVIGGGVIYKLALPWADKLYITLVDDSPQDADTFFPDYSEFKKEIFRKDGESNGWRYSFLELVKDY